MRILVAQNVSGSRRGGMSRMMGFIHDQLLPAGHTVDYLSAEDVPPRLGGRWSRFSFPLLVRQRAVRAARAGRPYDVVNVHEPSAAAVAGWRRGAGDPRVVVTSHGVERRGWEIALEEGRLGRDGPNLKTRIVYPLTALWQSQLALKRADHVLCLSFQDRDFLVDRLGLDAGRITRIVPAADPVYFEVAKRRDYGGVRRLLFFGTWLRRKGTSDLVEAFAVLAARHPDLALSVVGAGVPAEEVQRDFPAALRPRVNSYANLSEAEIADALAAADVFVLPSLFEGTPQTLIEAMASGMPVITTATSGMRDVVRDGCNGLLVPTRDPVAIVEAVERLIGSRELRERLGREGHREAAAEFTWERVARPVRRVYEALSEERGGER